MEENTEHCMNSADDGEFRRHLAIMRENGTFCDAFICIPGETKKLPVHRAVLASCSEFFRALFTNGLKETQQNDVNIHGVSVIVMEVIIQYAYTKQINLADRNVEELFAAADRFSILSLLEECINFLSHQLSPENCVGLLRFAKYYNCKKLIDRCWMYVLSNFKQITQRSQEFVQLQQKELLDILSNDRLDVAKEDEVLDAISRWVDFYPKERKQHLQTLLCATRLPFLSEESFVKNLLNKKELKQTRCWPHIKRFSKLVKNRKSPKDIIAQLNTREVEKFANPRIPGTVLFVIGGWGRDGVTDSIETYDRNTDQWFEMKDCQLNTPRAYHGTVTIEDRIYVLGGFNGSHYLNSVVCFDVSSKKWEERSPMYMPRCYVSAAEIDGTIYACGGYDGRQRHNTVERYNRNNNQWTLVRPMCQNRSDAGTASCQGKLYIAGGFDGHACLFSAERYDPVADQWTLLQPMTTSRSGVSMAVCEDKIYAIGGYDGAARLDSVEFYDINRHHWYTAPSMLLGRSNFSSVSMDGIVYAMGGYDGDKTSSSSECYIPTQKTWRSIGDMNIGRSAVSACTVTNINNACDFTYHGNRKPENSDCDNKRNPPTAVLNSENSKWLVLWRRNTNQLGEAR